MLPIGVDMDPIRSLFRMGDEFRARKAFDGRECSVGDGYVREGTTRGVADGVFGFDSELRGLGVKRKGGRGGRGLEEGGKD